MSAAIAAAPAESRMLPVHSPYDGSRVGAVAWTDVSSVPALIARAERGAAIGRALPRHARATALDRAAARIAIDHEAFARLIVAEAGKTIVQARKEVSRCCNTLRLSADEARRNAGEMLPFDAYAGSEGRLGWFSREPLGVIAAITPYNDPLNLAAHKLGPAIAGGNAIILKPSELAPLSAFRLVDVLIEAGLPEEMITVVAGGPDLGQAIVASRAVRMISFTGGFKTGARIAATAGLKKIAMDLGGNAPVIVMADCDFDRSLEACLSGAFWAAGQNCIGTQRLLVQAAIYPAFRDAFAAATRRLNVGNPSLEDTDIGPMISVGQASAARAKIEAALSAGAILLAGGKQEGNFLSPTVLERTPHHSDVWAEEIFAPVVTIEPFVDLEEALRLANATEYSLHAGIFTSDLHCARIAAQRIEAAGVMINDSSDFRFDAMPFGGYKYGSLGREGVRFAYEDMTQPKVVCINGR